MNYQKLRLRILLVGLLLLNLLPFVQNVNADTKKLEAIKVYNVAWQIINEKFYFKSRIHLDRWQNKFASKIDDLSDAHACISKLVTALKDPYTRFLTKEEYEEEQNIINSTFVGIGVKLANNEPVVLDILPESPASKEGIKPKDYILAINSKSTRGLRSSQVANLIRGPKATTLTMTIRREHGVITKTLRREEIKFKPVSTELLTKDIALLKIDSFVPEDTSEVFKNEILKIMSVDGLIIDLRNNSGGLFKNAIEIADAFLSEGKIVSTVNHLGTINEFANSSQLYKSPVVILVNENTASASEILTSALRENKRAVVLGRKTFGKGLVQEVIKLPDGSALHVTIAVYLTPSGKDINRIGIVPDEIVDDEKAQVQRAQEILSALITKRGNLIALK